MINALHNKMRRLSSWPLALVAFATTVAVFVYYDGYVQGLRDILGNATYLDLRIGGYGYFEALSFFELIGEQGREIYFQSTILDTVWPLGIAISGILFSPLAFRHPRAVVMGAFFPVMFGVFDLFENMGLLFMLSGYPEISPVLVSSTSVLTVIKQTAIPGAFFAFLVMPLIAIGRQFFGSKT